MLERGASLKDIQLFLGHSNPSSVERYTHVDNEQLKSVFRVTHPRCCMPKKVQMIDDFLIHAPSRGLF